MGYGDFVEISKAVYVEVAGEDFALDEKAKSSDSRVAILTGLTRKEVARQREILLGENPLVTGKASRASNVLTGWHQDADFTGPFGVPLPLQFDGSECSFSSLVKRYSGDMPARAMLEELLRVGAVRKTTDGELQVLTRFYIPEQTSAEGIKRLGDVIHDLGVNLEHNLNPYRKGAAWFERRVIPRNGIPRRRVPEFDRMLRKLGKEFLETLDSWITSAEDEALDVKDPISVGVEVFLFTDDPELVIDEQHVENADEVGMLLFKDDTNSDQKTEK